ncbi:hypothetical protein ACLOJK_026770 [Asimina triloba]
MQKAVISGQRFRSPIGFLKPHVLNEIAVSKIECKILSASDKSIKLRIPPISGSIQVGGVKQLEKTTQYASSFFGDQRMDSSAAAMELGCLLLPKLNKLSCLTGSFRVSATTCMICSSIFENWVGSGEGLSISSTFICLNKMCKTQQSPLGILVKLVLEMAGMRALLEHNYGNLTADIWNGHSHSFHLALLM